MANARRVFLVAMTIPFLTSASLQAGVKPEIRRGFDLVGISGSDRIYRVNVQLRNKDADFLSALLIPYDQVDWNWHEPREGRWRRSFMDIRGSERGGMGVWRSLVHDELWFPPPDRMWAAECELGGIEKNATIDLVFFLAVAETIDLANRPLRVGYGTCEEKPREFSTDYWSSAAEISVRRSVDKGTRQLYTYTGRGDTLVLFNMSGVRKATASEGWSVAGWDHDHIVFVSNGETRMAGFAVQCEESPGSTGLINWRDNSSGINYGFAFGPGTARYSAVDTLMVLNEPGWRILLPGLSVVLIAFFAMTAVLRRRGTKRR